MKKLTTLLLTLFITHFSFAQNTVLDSLVQKNGFPFQIDKNISFQGKGWDVLLNEIGYKASFRREFTSLSTASIKFPPADQAVVLTREQSTD